MTSTYTPFFIDTLLNHYRDRVAEARTTQERSFLRGEVRRYETLQHTSNIPSKNQSIQPMQKLRIA